MIITTKELANKLKTKPNEEKQLDWEITSEGDKYYIVFKSFGKSYRAAVASPPLPITFET